MPREKRHNAAFVAYHRSTRLGNCFLANMFTWYSYIPFPAPTYLPALAISPQNGQVDLQDSSVRAPAKTHGL